LRAIGFTPQIAGGDAYAIGGEHQPLDLSDRGWIRLRVQGAA
jgi:hypothetical protein